MQIYCIFDVNHWLHVRTTYVEHCSLYNCTLVLSLEKMSDIPKSMMAVRVHGKGIVCKMPRNDNFVFVF